MKKSKNQKIELQNDPAIKSDKKSKSKKKKKQSPIEEQKPNQEKILTVKQAIKQNTIKGQTQKCKLSESNPEKQQIQKITAQLNSLQFNGLISPNEQLCKLIDEKLETLTLNLFQSAVMTASSISQTIKLAKVSKLTPKQYFALNYTNKLTLIKRKLQELSQRKYNKFIKLIQEQTNRVEKMILISLENDNIFQEVFMDLKKSNVEWEFNEEYLKN